MGMDGTNGNGKAPLAFARDVPVLGQAYEVYEIQPMLTMRCRCQPGNKPMVIFGVTGSAMCQACRRIYSIDGFTFSRAEQRGSALLGINTSQMGEPT